MATTDRALVALLVEHHARHDGTGCWCGEDYLPRSGTTTRAQHAAHLADVIEAHYAELLAEEWGVRSSIGYFDGGESRVVMCEDEAMARSLAGQHGERRPLVHRYVTEWSTPDA